jgi:peptidoglycan hydrolase-like protein with peptidoglycan-binding domain
LSRSRFLALAVLGGAILLPAGDAAAAKRVFGDRDLREGMRGRDVRVLQDFLTRTGLETRVDGHYGPTTAAKVKAWEDHASQSVDGAMTRPEAAVLREQVETGATISDEAPTPEAQAGAPATAPGDQATIGPDGLAVAPESAPPEVKALIAAGNEIHDKPYRYGGGHGKLEDAGYDCSGSMSYVLRRAGMLGEALDSSGFMRHGDAGEGQWVTFYANPGHSYMIIAGLRFDTSGRADDDSRWDARPRSTSGYTVRHPPGL